MSAETKLPGTDSHQEIIDEVNLEHYQAVAGRTEGGPGALAVTVVANPGGAIYNPMTRRHVHVEPGHVAIQTTYPRGADLSAFQQGVRNRREAAGAEVPQAEQRQAA